MSNRWLDRETTISINNEILVSKKKWVNHTICCYMERSGDYHAKWNESERDIEHG